MKNHIAILFLAALFFSCAKQPPKKVVTPKKAPDPKYGVEFFKKRDLNNDNILTEAEFIKYHRKVFKKMDINNDQRISRSEARKANQEEIFDLFQKNYVTYGDTLEEEDRRFIEMDLNKTGKVGKEEYTKYYLRNINKKKALFD